MTLKQLWQEASKGNSKQIEASQLFFNSTNFSAFDSFDMKIPVNNHVGAIWVWKTLFKALASPSLIALSSKDPIITAFQLSDELKRLAAIESQFKEEYKKLRKIVQEFAVGLVEQARTSYELEVFLNYNPGGTPWKPGTYRMDQQCCRRENCPETTRGPSAGVSGGLRIFWLNHW